MTKSYNWVLRVFFPTGLILFCFCSASTIVPALGQTLVSGRVLDQNGSAIPTARVSATTGGREGFTTNADRNGEYSLTLTAGKYLLQFSASGFAPHATNLEVSDSSIRVNTVVLQVAGSTASVTITDNAGYQISAVNSATRTLTQLRDIPQSITVLTAEVARDQAMQSIADVVRYIPGITAIQGENNRDQVVIRGNSSSADFFLDGLRDDVQYYRDLYNLEKLEALKGPNAMIFGRGGGGGVINRVTKQATFGSLGELAVQAGSYKNRRITGDLNEPVNSAVALRLTGLYENSGSFRNRVGLERMALNPTITILQSADTQFRFAFEHLRDHRVADRGIPSYRGRPSATDVSTFFGNPDESKVRAQVSVVTGTLEHQAGKLNIKNRTLYGLYDRFYQNFVPASVSADQTRVNLSAYNNSSSRKNFFNQTDFTSYLNTGSIRHILLGGAEFGLQISKNFRQTGFFNNTKTIVTVPFDNPTVSIPMTFRQSPTDADNRVKALIAATYLQDQIELANNLQLLVGLRLDYFELNFHNNRAGDDLRRVDRLLSPRAGIVFKPFEPVSIYGSYSVSHLPSAGDQFSSLTSITQTLKPEKFTNYEVGAKWDVLTSLALTLAAYRLDRTNTRATDPNDPTGIVQTGSQRTNGFEADLSGSVTRYWKVTGGFAYQDAYVTRATTSAAQGARVAQVPRRTFSLWNNYRFSRKWRVGMGIVHRSAMFAAIDNRVVLPGYTRADAAVFYNLSEHVNLQANLENLFNKKYFNNADSNDNISPGYPRAIRFTLSWKF